MATYAQLQAESWWGREIQPQPLVDLGQRLRKAYGRPATAVGVKGNNRHLNGAHRSQEWIKNSRWSTNRSYTVQSGLTGKHARYICGFDFNPGSEKHMIDICSRLDRAVRAGRLEQVREWFGNDDGDNRVDGYDNVRNRIASSDASHLWHLHLTVDRRLVNDDAAMREVGDVLLGESAGGGNDGGDDLIGLRRGDKGQQVKGLQACLHHAGFGEQAGKVDGDYGPKTAAGVLAMRKSERSTAKSGDTFTGHAYAQLLTAIARRRAEAGGATALKQAKKAIETAITAVEDALAATPGGQLPAAVVLDLSGLPDQVTVPIEPADDEDDGES